MPSYDDQPALLVSARGHHCALPLAAVEETMRPLPIIPTASATPFVLGVCVIRGEPTPVVDLGALLGVAGRPAFSRFVTLRVGSRRVALAVETILGVTRFEGASVTTSPPLLRDAHGGLLTSFAVADRELVLILEASRIVALVDASTDRAAAE